MTADYNMNTMKSLRDAVGECLASLGEKYEDMIVITADVDTSSRVQAFQEKFPDRAYNTGIAEQNLISTAAGFALGGYKPLAFAFAPFASMRCFEQTRTDVCYPNLPVIIIGNGAGYSNGIMGPTHCGLEDSAIMSSIINMTVIEPGDPEQIARVIEKAMELNSPVYIRLGREATESLYGPEVEYEIGKALIPKEGDDGAFIASGIMVHHAVEAAKRIKKELGKDIRVVDMHTIKPLDEEAILDAAKTGRIVAVQDHNLQGGLGEKVAAVLGKNGVVCDLITRGCPEEFVPLATPEFLYARNGMDVDGLVEAMKELLEKEL